MRDPRATFWHAALPNVVGAEVKADRELLRIYLDCKGKNQIGFLKEINILVCKKWPSTFDLTLKVALLEKRLDSPGVEY